jgi:hypothetical protein
MNKTVFHFLVFASTITNASASVPCSKFLTAQAVSALSERLINYKVGRTDIQVKNEMTLDAEGKVDNLQLMYRAAEPIENGGKATVMGINFSSGKLYVAFIAIGFYFENSDGADFIDTVTFEFGPNGRMTNIRGHSQSPSNPEWNDPQFVRAIKQGMDEEFVYKMGDAQADTIFEAIFGRDLLELSGLSASAVTRIMEAVSKKQVLKPVDLLKFLE